MTVTDGGVTAAIVVSCSVVGILFAVWYTFETAKVKLDTSDGSGDSLPLLNSHHVDEVRHLTNTIAGGAEAFLFREYLYLAVFMVVFFVVILLFIGNAPNYSYADGAFTALSFLVGGVTSILSGFMGMKIAVFANGRTALKAADSIDAGFKVAFKAGCVMGFVLSSLGLIVLYVLIKLLELHYSDAYGIPEATRHLYEAIAGYGLGGSSIALFGRVGGGIYTKAADVGADLVGKNEKNIPEDDVRNPATIADNVGDNVGDIAGMGADLFGSFAESSCAAMVIASQSQALSSNFVFVTFPLLISAAGIIVCMLTSFIASHIERIDKLDGVEPVLKRQLLISTIIMTPVVVVLCFYFLPETFEVAISANHTKTVKNWYIIFCVGAGLWSGLIIGYVTEYYTSNAYS
jgi:inorganic pyrophosphatase